jgi:hydrogenase/urease accessory protein HupE
VARSIRQVDCGGTGPGGQVVRVDGLQARPRDVLVRVALLDRPVRTWMLRSGAGSFHIRGDQTGTQVFRTYVQLGLEHILSGLDHLLFVLCLVLLVQGGWRVMQTITAFTVAHSVTLGLAALGLVRVPQPPVEAVIALSILLLASELAGQQAGRPGLTRRFPWSVALGCGLLHGLGFAGALTDVGLPEGDVYLALFGFNLGVELGQLLFVGLLLALMGLLRRLPVVGPAWIRGVPAYGIGSLAAFWTLQRIAAF